MLKSDFLQDWLVLVLVGMFSSKPIIGLLVGPDPSNILQSLIRKQVQARKDLRRSLQARTWLSEKGTGWGPTHGTCGTPRIWWDYGRNIGHHLTWVLVFLCEYSYCILGVPCLGLFGAYRGFHSVVYLWTRPLPARVIRFCRLLP